MKQRQRGATFLGMVTILLILGAGLYAGLRLVPVFLEYTKVARALEQVTDPVLQNAIGGKPDRIFDPIGFQILIHVGIGESSVGPEIETTLPR